MNQNTFRNEARDGRVSGEKMAEATQITQDKHRSLGIISSRLMPKDIIIQVYSSHPNVMQWIQLSNLARFPSPAMTIYVSLDP